MLFPLLRGRAKSEVSEDIQTSPKRNAYFVARRAASSEGSVYSGTSIPTRYAELWIFYHTKHIKNSLRFAPLRFSFFIFLGEDMSYIQLCQFRRNQAINLSRKSEKARF